LSEGLCEIDGELWQDRNGAFVPTHKRPLGYVFQEASLFPHLSVRRNLRFGAPRNGEAAPQGGVAFDEIVDLLGVRPLLDRSPRNLSGGERQRVAIGRALMSRPKLLLMDEPLSGLDRAAKDEIMPLLERLRDRHLLPIIYVSHDVAEVERLADQIVLMGRGRVLAAGPLADLQSDPSLPLAMARDAAVVLEAVVEAHDACYGLLTLRVPGGHFVAPGPPAPIGEQRRIRIVARDGSLAREPPGPSSILNVLPARVVSAKAVASHEMLAVLALGHEGRGARLLSRLTRKSWDQLGFTEGATVFAQVKAVALERRRDLAE
jgi:molybdate transport system ATP-binding protein